MDVLDHSPNAVSFVIGCRYQEECQRGQQGRLHIARKTAGSIAQTKESHVRGQQ